MMNRFIGWLVCWTELNVSGTMLLALMRKVSRAPGGIRSATFPRKAAPLSPFRRIVATKDSSGKVGSVSAAIKSATDSGAARGRSTS